MSDIYQQLAQHLDGLPGGYPATESGVELRILRRLFTPEEAQLAVSLTMLPEPVEKIAQRCGVEPEDISDRLYEMSRKGLLMRSQRHGDTRHSEYRYSANQFVIGIWEYQVNRLTPELIEDMNEYIPELFKPEVWRKAPQLRTIPIQASLDADRSVLAYEQAEELVRTQTQIAVAPCICRREHKMVGEGCDKPEESCLVFGRGTEYYIDNGLGRSIEVDEALQILERAEEAGLVLQPSNSQRIVNICTCCGCCCQVLKSIKRHPQPASVVSSAFYAEVDTTECIACEDCVERCQMDAITMEEVALIDLDRCIGCGLCVTSCSSESIYLVRKSEEDLQPVPRTFGHALLNLSKARGKGRQASD
jgi:Pyruvate/2-oxoacid:ferredoxin oxidoreductase delta subunit/DNA-binding Lrp family transcriptional regulator